MKAFVEVVKFNAEDVITTSTVCGDNTKLPCVPADSD